jgi:multiple sugar transport system permease protein
MKEKYWSYIFILPAFFFISFVLFYPILHACIISFQHYILYEKITVGTPFIGLENYCKVLRDPIFWLSLQNSVIFVGISIFLQFIIGFAVALLLNIKLKGRAIFRTLVLLPYAIPSVIVAIMWAWMLHPVLGVINDMLLKLGLIKNYLSWLASTDTALLSIIIANVWRGFPFFAIMLLAGLQTIPQELYEAAAIDGAGNWQKFKHITIPMIKYAIFISTALRIIWTFNYVDIIYVMTGGGPYNATQTLATWIWTNAYTALDFGYASALALIMLAILIVATYIYIKIAKVV